ncbi:response regulator transcription factor [Nocardia sp. CA-119907]|uniref:response regulator transcription factor n=1 Tax=Nocardia sp. CA-119907 TaxID=3239973 RepID=UPI003D9622EB
MSNETTEARILVVDDEPMIAELLATSLRFQGFEVATAVNGSDGLDKVRSFRPDALIADVMMPGMDGFGMVRRMRADGDDVPVLFLSARDEVNDRLAGLALGADDYVAKPFRLEEVIARLRAVLRRSGTIDPADPPRLRVGDLVLDEDSHEVWKGGTLIALSPTEFTLLRYFMLNRGKVLSKAKILDHVWHYDFGGDTSVVESYVSYLRRKVDNVEPKMLHTLRGVGYVLRAAPQTGE